MWRRILSVLLAIPLLLLAWHTLVRLVRHYYKFPMPEFLAGIIDNPWRRRFQPPDEMPLRHGIGPGMRVLEVGPGNGRYTLATARRVGTGGQVVAIDIEPKMVERVQARVQAEGVTNVEARLANVHDLPFDAGTFDAIYLITVMGEIPQPERAMAEFYRVLKPGGSLAFSELLMDPDYPLPGTLIRLGSAAGFQVRARLGGFFAYTLVLERADR